MSSPKLDGRIVRGEQTRQAILRRATDIASAEGLEGLSIGRLATELGVSKSGVFAHFGSKEDLQLATVEEALDVFVREVVEPALEAPPGLRRVWTLCADRVEHMRSRYAGGCFFYAASAEFDARPGRVRDRLAELRRAWLDLLTDSVRTAHDAGEIKPEVDADRLAFAVDAYCLVANGDARLLGDPSAYTRGLDVVLATLRDAAVDPSALPPRP